MGPWEAALAAMPPPSQAPGGPQPGGGGAQWCTGSTCGGAGLSHSPLPVPHQAMDSSGTPSVPLMIGCAVSCMALLTLLVIYAAFWR